MLAASELSRVESSGMGMLLFEGGREGFDSLGLVLLPSYSILMAGILRDTWIDIEWFKA